MFLFEKLHLAIVLVQLGGALFVRSVTALPKQSAVRTTDSDNSNRECQSSVMPGALLLPDTQSSKSDVMPSINFDYTRNDFKGWLKNSGTGAFTWRILSERFHPKRLGESVRGRLWLSENPTDQYKMQK